MKKYRISKDYLTSENQLETTILYETDEEEDALEKFDFLGNSQRCKDIDPDFSYSLDIPNVYFLEQFNVDTNKYENISYFELD